jgi:hypothetical protein
MMNKKINYIRMNATAEVCFEDGSEKEFILRVTANDVDGVMDAALEFMGDVAVMCDDGSEEDNDGEKQFP